METQYVQASSTSETTPESVPLVETGPGSGRFVGTVELRAGPPAADGRVQAAQGDVLTVHSPSAGVSGTAAIDTQPPAISAISAQPAALSARVQWTTDEPASSVVRYGTSPASLDLVQTVANPVTLHQVQVSGLAPETPYYYQVSSTDGAGNSATGPLGSWTTAALAPILFVDDDLGATYERFFVAALQASQLAFDTWEVATMGGPPGAAQLQAYPLVIWNTGYDYTSVGAGLSATEQSALSAYLEGGGRLFLSGQDILYNGVGSSFIANYLQLSAYSNDVISGSHTLAGVAGHPLTDGLSLAIARPSDYPAFYIDALQPLPAASGIFLPGVSGLAYPFSATSSWGNGTGGTFGVVFFAFPFESISTTAPAPNNQATVLRRVVDYLRAGPAPGIQVTAPSPSSTTSEAGGAVSFNVRLATQPAAHVTLSVASSAPAEGAVSTASLVFTPANWNTPQTV
ncbi:MAG: fibronectin type III domain-containing protein, partial [Verrucomicrobiota bacterium]